MEFEKKYQIRFFCVHLCLIIPMVLVSVLVANIVTDGMRKLEQRAMQRRLDDAAVYFLENYQNYYEESILLSECAQLAFYRISANHVEAQKGIELLKMKSYFDNRIRDVFLDYGTDIFYTTSGTARKELFFSSVLGCRKESEERGLAAVEEESNMLSFLYEADGKGVVLYTYPVHRIGDEYVTVCFTMPFEQVAEIFKTENADQVYVLEAQDGSSLRIKTDENGRNVFAAAGSGEYQSDEAGSKMLKKTVEAAGVTIRLYYRENSFDLSDGFYQMQLVNIILIAAGIFLSALVSWILSKSRIKEIVSLERVAGGNYEEMLPEKNAYRRLQDMIQTGLTEAGESKQRACQSKEQLRERTVYMLLQGMENNLLVINQTFRELGYAECPEYYYIGILCSDVYLEEEQIPEPVRQGLTTHVNHQGFDCIAFLLAAASTDENQLQRKSTADDVRSRLHQNGIRKVRLGMSRIYEDPLMIGCAYSEAVSVFDYIISGKMKDFYGCWENAVQENYFNLPDKASLEKFSEALEERNYEDAKKWMNHIMNSFPVGECTPANKAYIRYAVQECLIRYLSEESIVENAGFLKECLNIDAGNEKEFVQTMTKVLKKCLVKKEPDNFARMLSYIEQNFSRSELSYEEVAAAGGISKTYVSRLFRAKTGMSYIEYLISVRMNRAGILLRTTQHTVSEIAKMVGYEDISGFRKCFKNVYGMSAAEYRAREKKLDADI